MEYYARVSFLSTVFTSRCVGNFRHLARPSVSQDINFPTHLEVNTADHSLARRIITIHLCSWLRE